MDDVTAAKLESALAHAGIDKMSLDVWRAGERRAERNNLAREFLPTIYARRVVNLGPGVVAAKAAVDEAYDLADAFLEAKNG